MMEQRTNFEKQKSVTLVYNKYQAKGIGAWLRVAMNICAFCLKYNCNFHVVFKHPINNFILDSTPQTSIKELFRTRTWSDILSLLEKNENVYISHDDERFPQCSEDVLKKVRLITRQNAFNVRSSVYFEFSQYLKQSNIRLEGLHVIHLRFGDLTLVHGLKPCKYTLDEVYRIFESTNVKQVIDQQNVVLLCDSVEVKMALRSKYHRLHVFTTSPVHTMKEHGQNEADLMKTFFEFLLISNATKIIAMSAANYRSNFAYVCYDLFAVPIKDILVTPQRPHPNEVCAHCSMLYDEGSRSKIPNIHEYNVCCPKDMKPYDPVLDFTKH